MQHCLSEVFHRLTHVALVLTPVRRLVESVKPISFFNVVDCLHWLFIEGLNRSLDSLNFGK